MIPGFCSSFDYRLDFLFVYSWAPDLILFHGESIFESLVSVLFPHGLISVLSSLFCVTLTSPEGYAVKKV